MQTPADKAATDEMSVESADAEKAAKKAVRLKDAAARALAEAEARRAKAEGGAEALALPEELGGRDGPEPTRFGDWERKGLISDF